MKKFCISLLFILVSLFAGDRLISRLLSDNMKYSNDRRIAKLLYETTDISEDVILMGSSRCEHHYVSSILADSLGCTVYNCGWANSRIYSYYYLLHQILRVHTPRLICLEVKTSDWLCEDENGNGRMFVVYHYAPFFGRVDEADELFRDLGDYALFKLSSIYRYNADMSEYLSAVLRRKPCPKDENGGYVPMPYPDTELRKLITSRIDRPYNSLKIKYFERFMELCKKHDIAVVICMSPYYSHTSEDLYSVPREIAERYGAAVFDYHSAGLFLDHTEYFRDHLHLNAEGARVYTSIFARDLKEYLAGSSFWISR